jgi:hypothetical protein
MPAAFALNLHSTFVASVLHLCCTCAAPVLHLCCTCAAPVLHLCCICAAPVLHILRLLCNGHLLTCCAARPQVSYLDKSPLVAIEAVSIMAGFGKQFATQHYLGREAVDVPAEFVEALLPGASALLQRLRSSNQQAQLRSGVDHSEVYFVEATIRLTQAFWRALPFKLQRYGGAYLMAQLPAVKAVLSGPQWPAFQQQVLQQHEALGADGAWPGVHPAAP